MDTSLVCDSCWACLMWAEMFWEYIDSHARYSQVFQSAEHLASIMDEVTDSSIPRRLINVDLPGVRLVNL